MATVTWAGHSGSWSFPTFWRPLTVPGSGDVAQFNATDFSSATIDAAASIGSVAILSGSRASILVQDTLTVTGQFVAAGGTVELDLGGTISGGTIDLRGATLVANGGVVDGSVWIGDLGRGLTVTEATIAATETARSGAVLTVAGTLSLAGGTYSGAVLSLDGFGTVQSPELDVANGDLVLFDADTRIVLSLDDPSHLTGSNPSGPAPTLGGIGTIASEGLIVDDAPAATIDALAFVNAGSIELDNATVLGEQQSFLSTMLTWTATISPTLVLAGGSFENDGTITGLGATLDVTAGDFVNNGMIDLGDTKASAPILMPQPHIGAIDLLSTLDVGAGVASFANSGTITANTIEFDGLVSFASLGTLIGTVVIDGTLDLGGGTLDSSALDPRTSYVINGTVLNGTILDSDGRIDTTTATLDQVAVFDTQPTTLLDVQGPGTVVLDGSTTELAYTTAAIVRSLTVRTGAAGLLDRIGIRAGRVTFASGTLISDTLAGSSIAIGGGTFIENGSIELNGSNLEVSTLDGTGTITLASNAVLTIDSIAPGAAITIAFGAGTNALILPADASGLGPLGLTLTGLASGDLIDFVGVSDNPGTVFAAAGATVHDGLLLVQGASGDQASVDTDSGATSGLTFAASADPDGGTIVTVACFRYGTRLATPTGECPVEHLQIGDRVLTLSGRVRRIKWLGRRAYPRDTVRRQGQVRPVRIAMGALGAGLPRRTLDVSPLHALLISGVLVPAGALVNGRTITRAPAADTAYVHVELGGADIILAEGAPTETFVDCDNRMMFDNAAEFAALYPGSAPHRWAFPAPRVEEGWQLEAIRGRLAGCVARERKPGNLRGHIEVLAPRRVEGWLVDDGNPLQPVAFELLAAGRQLGCLVANRYRTDLDQVGEGRGACAFTADLPDLDAAALHSLALVRLSDGSRLTA